MTLEVPPPETRGWRAVVRVLRSPLHPLQGPLRAAQIPLQDIASVLFPSPCRVCGEPLLRADFSPVCDLCIARIRPQQDNTRPQQDNLCDRCGEHLGFHFQGFGPPGGADRKTCALCRLAPPPFARAVAHAVYQDELREMLHLLKYDRVRAVAVPLGRMLAERMAQMESDSPRAMTVVAVPLFPARQRERGFNQTILMCDVALRILRRNAPDWNLRPGHSLLERIRATESQFRLTPAARHANLSGAFAAPEPARVQGKHVLLVDDIFTTGATARECAATLLRAGALSVNVATLARAQTDVAAMWDAGSFAASSRTYDTQPILPDH